MDLEKRIFFHDNSARLPSENLAINQAIVDLVNDGDYEAVVRIYSHKNGVILGRNESREDINVDYCTKQGYEIVNRSSGGSTIFVTPELTLCYSVFANLRKTKLEENVTNIYKKFTLPLAKKLGDNFVVEGSYYLKAKLNGASHPFAGHAMRLYKHCVQFDGVVHKKKFDLDILARIIKLRELHRINEDSYILMHGDIYDLKGNKILNAVLSSSTLVKRERDELEKTQNFDSLGLDENIYLNCLYESFSETFEGLKKIEKLDCDNEIVRDYKNKIKRVREGKIVGLGHCFVDFMEPEPVIN